MTKRLLTKKDFGETLPPYAKAYRLGEEIPQVTAEESLPLGNRFVENLGSEVDSVTPSSVGLIDQVGGDPATLINRWKAAAGMGAASNEIKVIKSLELVLRAEVEHLAQGVGQIEGRTKKDPRVLPSFRSEDLSSHDMFPQILHVGFLDHAINDLLGVSRLFLLPVVSMPGVYRRDKHV